ncbi:MAG: hypothetical protein ACREQI_02805 [Candidatus Binataceae bacterium]
MNATMRGIVAAMIVSLFAIAPAMAAGSQSDALNDYLHSNRLPFVSGEVHANQSGKVTSVTLTGEVRTEKGKRDAEQKTRDFLDNQRLRVKNLVEINPTVGFSAAGGPPSGGAASQPSDSGNAEDAAEEQGCSKQCYQDETNCNTQCMSQAASNAPSSATDWQGMIGLGTQTAACKSQCGQTRQDCINQCSQPAGPPPDEGDDGSDQSSPDSSQQ